MGCLLRAGNSHFHFISQSQGGQKPIPLCAQRLAQLEAQLSALQVQNTVLQDRKVFWSLLQAPSMEKQVSPVGQPAQGVCLCLPPSLSGSMLGHTTGNSSSPQSPLPCCKVRSSSVSIPMGLVSFSVTVPHSLQPLPHEDALRAKAGLSHLPLLLRELGSL